MKKKALLGVLSLMSAFALASCGESETPTTPDQSQKDDDKGGTDKVVTKHTVTVNTSDANAGSVTGAGQYDAGTNVTVTATTNEGYVFLGFYKGENKVSENKTYSFKLDADVTLTAKYRALADYTVTVNVNEAAAGSVTGAGTVKEGSSVTLTATTNTGYLFLGFYDSADNALTTEPTYTISKVEANVEINAKYRAKDQYAVIVANTNEDAGSITGSGNVSEGESVTLTATVNAGYTFLGFYDGETRVSDANATTYTFTPTADTNLTAKWLVQEFDFDVEIVEAGDGSVETGEVSYTDDNDNNGKYKTNEVIKLTATPKTGYQFKGWYVGDTFLSDQDKDYEFVMLPQNTTVKAVFEDKQCSISIYSDFDAPAEYKITVEGDNGIYGCGDTFLYGSEITIAVDTEQGLTFKRFYTLDENDNKITFEATDFVITDDIEIYAEFEAEKKVVTTDLDINSNKINPTDPIATITVVDGDGISDVDDEYYYKSKIVVKLEDLDDGFVFDGWYKYDSVEDDYVLISEYEEFEYYIKATDNDFVAKVTPKKVSVTVVNETSDLGSINYETDEFEYLEVLDLEAVAESGYRLKAITIDGVTYTDTEVEYQITSLEDITITVEFEKDVFDVNTYINVSSSLDDVYVNQFYAANDSLTFNGAGVEYQGTHKVTAEDIDGYTFVGWYAGKFNDDKEEGYKDLTALVTDLEYEFTMGADNVELTACYTRNKYKINYNANGGDTEKDRFTIDFGTTPTLEVPTRYGFSFQYWYYINDKDENVPLTDRNGKLLQQYSFTNDLDVKAKWIDGVVYVTYETDGGDDMSEQEVTFNHTITKPADPKKEGYTFAGWYDEDGVSWNWNTAIVKNTTLYAHWTINQYDLEVTSQDSTIVTVNSEVNGSYDYGSKVILTANIPDSGYSFVGWELDGEIISDAVNFEYTIPAKKTTLIARYKVNSYSVSVGLYNWTSNCATITSGAGTYNYKSTVTIKVAPKDGFYVYMYRINGGSWISFTENELTFAMPNQNTTVQIGIQCIQYKFTVSKNVPEGNDPYFLDSTDTTHRVSYTTYWAWKKTFVAENIEGYTFQGWYYKGTDNLIKEDATTLTYVVPGYPNHGVIKPGNTEIEARYKANAYALTVTKDVNGAVTNMYSGNLDYKKTYALSTTNITGYTFKGWFVNGSDTPISTSLSYTHTMQAGDTSIVAKFAINKYNVYTNSVSGNTEWTIVPGKFTIGYNGSTYTATKSFNASLEYNTKVTFTRTETTDGYEWDGWYVGSTRVSTDDTCVWTLGNSSVYVYPTWKPKTVWLNYNLGTATAGGNVAFEATMGENYTLDIPELAGYDFGGWFYQSKGQRYYLTDETGKSYSYYDYYISTEELTISPAWDVTMRTVTFDWDDGLSTTTTSKVENNNKVSQPTNPTKRGYTFVGWFNGTDEWRFDTDTVTADVTLTAHWTINKYKYYIGADTGWGTLEYYVNDSIKGTLSGSDDYVELELDYGTPIQLKANPYKGRVFSYYEYDNENDCDDYFDSEMTDDFTYAVDTSIYCNFDTIDEMKYFEFTSNFDTIDITGSNSYYKSVTSLVVPDYVNSIADGALSGFSKLTSITIPYTGTSKDATGESKLFCAIFSKTSGDSLVEREQSYLNGTTLVKAAKRYIPTGLYSITVTSEKKIAPCAFYNLQARCSSITLPNNVEEIGSYAFYMCYFYSIKLPSTLKKIDAYAFKGLQNLSSINVPNTNMEYIGEGAFEGCTSLTSITVPFIGSSYDAENAESLFTWVFGTNTYSKSYKCSQNYNSSNSRTAYVPESLKTITINPNEDEDFFINYGAFMNLTNVTSITLPNASNKLIPQYLFQNCTALVSVNGLFEQCDGVGAYAFQNCTALTAFSTENNTSSISTGFNIGDYAFDGCTSLASVNLTSIRLRSINKYAFQNCTSLTTVTFGNTDGWYVTIQDYAFSGCTALKSIAKDEFYSIGSYAFNGCTALTSFSVNNSIRESIHSYAFNGCTSLTTVSIPKFNDAYSTSKYAIYDHAFNMCTALKTIVIPNTATYIGYAIFSNCRSLSNLTVPFIGRDANSSSTSADANYVMGYWYGKEMDSSIYMYVIYQKESNSGTAVKYYHPSVSQKITLTNTKNIPAYSFANFNNPGSSSTSIINQNSIDLIIEGVQTGTYEIGSYTFYQFQSITINQEVENAYYSINAHAFDHASKALNYQTIITNNAEIMTNISEYAFASVLSAVDLVIPNTTKSLSIGNYAFSGCTGLTSLTIGKNCILGSNVFDSLSSKVTNVTFTGSSAELIALAKTWKSTWYKTSSISSIESESGQSFDVTTMTYAS